MALINPSLSQLLPIELQFLLYGLDQFLFLLGRQEGSACPIHHLLNKNGKYVTLKVKPSAHV